jgi:hypothetical protein
MTYKNNKNKKTHQLLVLKFFKVAYRGRLALSIEKEEIDRQVI